MELGTQIKSHRAQAGLSQDELAAKIYVSRQTISNWENDKTYPDVQSLLHLSAVFDVPVDTLIKGDVEAMEHKVGTEGKKLLRLGYAMVGLFLALLAVVGWGLWQHFEGWGAKIAPTAVLALLLLVALITVAEHAEQLKHEHDLLTYQEILAFTQGNPVDRAGEKSRLVRASALARVKDRLVYVGVAMIIGAVAGYGIAWIAGLLAR